MPALAHLLQRLRAALSDAEAGGSAAEQQLAAALAKAQQELAVERQRGEMLQVGWERAAKWQISYAPWGSKSWLREAHAAGGTGGKGEGLGLMRVGG